MSAEVNVRSSVSAEVSASDDVGCVVLLVELEITRLLFRLAVGRPPLEEEEVVSDERTDLAAVEDHVGAEDGIVGWVRSEDIEGSVEALVRCDEVPDDID